MRTPGTRNGSHKAIPTLQRHVIKPSATHSVADIAASQSEFHTAVWPAFNAPWSSVHVRETETSWKTGSATERRQTATVAIPQNQNQRGPSWRRNSAGGTTRPRRGHGMSRRENRSNKSIGPAIRGQLTR